MGSALVTQRIHDEPKRRGRADSELRDPAMWVLLALTVFVANTAIRFAKLYRFNAVDDA